MRKVALALCLLSLIPPARAGADALADLRLRLEGLKPEGVIRARVEVQSRSESSDDKNVDSSTEAVLGELGPDGLRMGWTTEQLTAARAAESRQHRDPNAARSGASLGDIPASTLANLLDHAWGLLLTLDGATLVDARLDDTRSPGGRLLILHPKHELSASAAKVIKSWEDELKLWLDADGWPVASERAVKMKGSKFFVSFGGEQHAQRDYARSAGRLVIVHQVEQDSGNGLGTESHGTTTTTVTLLP